MSDNAWALIILLAFSSIPLMFPLINLYRIIVAFLKKGRKINKIFGHILDGISTTFIPFISLMCISSLKGAKEAIIVHSEMDLKIHATLADEHIAIVIVLLVFSIISFWVLKLFSEKLSPILYIIFSSSLLMEIIFTIFFCIQVKSGLNYGVIIIPVYGFINLSLLYIYLLKEKFDEFIAEEKDLNRKYENKIIMKLYGLIIKASTLPMAIILFMFPILIIMQLLLVIFGQQPDSIIKVFVETSDWTFSKLQAPPPIYVPETGGHYLCTVALKGHSTIVKPVRYGLRQNNIITVNRQLLVANAFENILEEYTPKLHKVIRGFYDKFGLPLSKCINSAISADFIYILMKPLEWIFLLCLYLVDKNPENRIAVQYLPKK